MHCEAFAALEGPPENGEHHADDRYGADHEHPVVDLQLDLVGHLQPYRSGEFATLPATVYTRIGETQFFNDYPLT